MSPIHRFTMGQIWGWPWFSLAATVRPLVPCFTTFAFVHLGNFESPWSLFGPQHRTTQAACALVVARWSERRLRKTTTMGIIKAVGEKNKTTSRTAWPGSCSVTALGANEVREGAVFPLAMPCMAQNPDLAIALPCEASEPRGRLLASPEEVGQSPAMESSLRPDPPLALPSLTSPCHPSSYSSSPVWCPLACSASQTGQLPRATERTLRLAPITFRPPHLDLPLLAQQPVADQPLLAALLSARPIPPRHEVGVGTTRSVPVRPRVGRKSGRTAAGGLQSAQRQRWCGRLSRLPSES